MTQSKSYDRLPEMIISPDKGYYATFHTEKGPIRVKLSADKVPETVRITRPKRKAFCRY